jgi:hypothetical protein
MTAASPDPSDAAQPNPKDTIETILKAMEKKPDDFQLEGQTRLSDLGFTKEDFGIFTTYYQHPTYHTVLTHVLGTARTRLMLSPVLTAAHKRDLLEAEQ